MENKNLMDILLIAAGVAAAIGILAGLYGIYTAL